MNYFYYVILKRVFPPDFSNTMAERGGFESGTQSRNYKLLRAKFDLLVSIIAPDVGTVARKAFSKNLISSKNKEEAHNDMMPQDGRANMVLEIILRKVELNENHFDDFLSILKEIPTMRGIADELDRNRKKNAISSLDYSDSGLASQMSTLSVSTPPSQRQELAGLSTNMSVSNGVPPSGELSSQPKPIPQLDSNSIATTQELVATPQQLQRTQSEPSTNLKAMVDGLKDKSSASNRSADKRYLHPSSVTEIPSEMEANLVTDELSKSNESIQESRGSRSSTLIYPDHRVATPQSTEQTMADTQALMNKTFECTRQELHRQHGEITQKDLENHQLRLKVRELDMKLKETEDLLKAKEQEVVVIEQKKDAEICTLKEEIQKLQTKIACNEKEKDEMKQLHDDELSTLADEHKVKCQALNNTIREVMSQKEKVEQELVQANHELALKRVEKKAEVAEKQSEISELKACVAELRLELFEKNNQLDVTEKELLRKEKELAEEKHKNCEKEFEDLKQQHHADKQQYMAENEELNKKHLAERRRSEQLEEKVQMLETQVSQGSQSSTGSEKPQQKLESQVSHSSRTSMTSQMSQNSLDSIDKNTG